MGIWFFTDQVNGGVGLDAILCGHNIDDVENNHPGMSLCHRDFKAHVTVFETVSVNIYMNNLKMAYIDLFELFNIGANFPFECL